MSSAIAAGDTTSPVVHKTGKYATRRNTPAEDIARGMEPAPAATRITNMSP
jgi:hypothetical protein